MESIVKTEPNESVRAIITKDELESLEALRRERLRLAQAELAKVQPIVRRLANNLSGEVGDLEGELAVREQELIEGIKSLSATPNTVALYPQN